jgi:signal transduction histidine kinase
VGKGSGLGLFIVHDIIESHGGTINVDSRLDEGTTFIIWLPGGNETQ